MNEYISMHNEDLKIHHNLEIVLYIHNIDVIDEIKILLLKGIRICIAIILLI
jgi:hypothetical protein